MYDGSFKFYPDQPVPGQYLCLNGTAAYYMSPLGFFEEGYDCQQCCASAVTAEVMMTHVLTAGHIFKPRE